MVPSCGVPVLAVCGFSGSGKTTLLEKLIPELCAQGLAVGVVKHDAHGVEVDRPGKDSDRLFRAGAQVCLRAPNERFLRYAPAPERDLPWALGKLAEEVDLVLVEGHKDTPLPKVWLVHPENPAIPGELENLLEVLPWGEDRVARVAALVARELAAQAPPLFAGILMGGASRRMGQPKQTLTLGGASLLARQVEVLAPQVQQVVYLGQGALPADAPALPMLPDPPGPGGPLAGMVGALRWQPRACWLFVPTDAVALSPEFVAWLAGLRRPGVWGVQLLDHRGNPEPLFAVLAPQIRPWAERAWEAGGGPKDLATCPRLRRFPVPEALAAALFCVNTPEEWAKIQAGNHRRRETGRCG